MDKTIKVTVTPDGKTTVEAFGYTGETCIRDTAALTNAIGFPVNTEVKSEFFMSEAEAHLDLRQS